MLARGRGRPQQTKALISTMAARLMKTTPRAMVSHARVDCRDAQRPNKCSGSAQPHKDVEEAGAALLAHMWHWKPRAPRGDQISRPSRLAVPNSVMASVSYANVLGAQRRRQSEIATQGTRGDHDWQPCGGAGSAGGHGRGNVVARGRRRRRY